MNRLEQELQINIRDKINLTDIFRAWIVSSSDGVGGSLQAVWVEGQDPGGVA